MRRFRPVVGMALLASVLLVILSGFVVMTQREFMMIVAGFVAGLITVFCLEQVKRIQNRRSVH